MENAERVDSGDIPREVIDRLKAKYRKEALKAVAAAEKDGFEKGKATAEKEIEALHEQNRRWRAVAEAVQSSKLGSSKPTLLVQYVVEQIYRKMRSDVSEVPASKIKEVLISSTDSLLDSLPEIALVQQQDSAVASSSHVQGAKDRDPTPSAAPLTATSGSVSKPVMCRVLHQPMAPKYFVRVKILDTTGNVVKGVFSDSEYTSYRVECQLFRINYKTIDANRKGHIVGRQMTLSYALDKRNREFKALYSQLVKDYSRLIIPELPSRPYKARSSRDNTTEQKVRFRKRQFSVWLQYLSNVERMQVSPLFVTFLTGLPKLGGLDLSTSKRDIPSRAAGPAFRMNSNDDVQRSVSSSSRRKANFPATANSSAAAPSLQLPVLEPGSLHSRLQDVSECFIYARGSESLTHRATASSFHQQPLLYSPQSDELQQPGSASEQSTHSVTFNILARRQQAHRDLLTVQGDVAQLEPVALAATEKAHALAASYSSVCSALGEFTQSLCDWGSCEAVGSMEHTALGAITDASGAIQTPMDQIAESIQEECYEHMEFLLGSCVRAARDTLDKVQRAHPDWSFLSDVTLTRESGGGINLKSANDAIASAVTLAQSWECSRRIRSSMMLHQMLVTAKMMQQQHAMIRKLWTHATETIERLQHASTAASVSFNSSTTSNNTNSKNRSRGRSNSGQTAAKAEHGKGLVPALEAESSTLKTAILDEIQDYEENIRHIKETQEKAAQMQEEFMKVTGSMASLRSFKAIFSRPKLPKGVRRDPTRVPVGKTQAAQKPSVTTGVSNTDATSGKPAAASSTNKLDANMQQPNHHENSRRRAGPVGNTDNLGVLEDSEGDECEDEEDVFAQVTQARITKSAVPKPSKSKVQHPEQSRPQQPSRRSQHPYAYNADDMRRDPDPAPEHNISEFQDLRQRNNAKRANRAAAHHGGSGGAAGKLQSQSKSAPSSAIPENVFGSVPQPAAALSSATAAPSSSGAGTTDSSTNNIPPSPQVSSKSNPPSHKRSSETAVPPSAAAETRKNQQPAKQRRSAPDQTPAPVAGNSSTVDVGAEGLPSGWQPVACEDGSVYFYHTVTRVSRWDRPTEEVAAALEARLQKSQTEVGEAVQRRKEEMENEKKQQEQRENEARKLQSKVKNIITHWRQPAGQRHPRDLASLLSSVHLILDYVPAEGIVGAGKQLSATSTPSELRKAYLKAVRFVHPDKLPDEIGVERELIAEAVFITLTDEFDKYIAAHSS